MNNLDKFELIKQLKYYEQAYKRSISFIALENRPKGDLDAALFRAATYYKKRIKDIKNKLEITNETTKDGINK